jgi:trk/ktr system potassium uptake protein
MKVVITGCGRVGAQLAEMLSLDGHEVVVIDRNRSSFNRLSKSFSGEVIEGMAFDEDTLHKAGIEDAHAFASVTNYDNANLMTAEVATHIFQVPKVVARLYNPDKEETYQALGLDYVCGSEVMARAFLERIFKPAVRMRASCCNSLLDLVEFDCPPRWIGKRTRWAEESMGLRLAYVVRGGEAFFCGEDDRFQKDDEITALVSSRRIRRLERFLKSHGRG